MRQRLVIVVLFLLLVPPLVGAQVDRSVSLSAPGAEVRSLPNVIVIGWDGVQRDRFLACYSGELPECPDGLPNLEAMSGDRIWTSTTTSGATATKPGWSQILSGYSADAMGIWSNFEYQPLPEEYSLFEKLEAYFGDPAIDTVFIAGKGIHVGATCQGETNVEGHIEQHGQPWCLTKRQLDSFQEAEASHVPNSTIGGRALDALVEHFSNHPDQALVAFFHFAEPDVSGHAFGVDSMQYAEQLFDLDIWLGSIMEQLEAFGALENTLLYVITDHGFDVGGYRHWNAPYGILASNDPLIVRGGDRQDLAPTVLERYGVKPDGSTPPLDGHSLYSPLPFACIPAGGAFVDYEGAPACCDGLAVAGLDYFNRWPAAPDRCVPPSGGQGDESGYCTVCGDDQCGTGESVCNCPQDCEQGEPARGGGPAKAAATPLEIACPLGTLKTTLLAEGFEAWPPDGWNIVNLGGDCVFQANGHWGRPNNAGDSDACADADSDACGPGTMIDTSLRTPVLDLSGMSQVYLQFKTHYLNYLGEDTAMVGISTDGGANWSNLLTWNEDYAGPLTVDLDLTPFIGSNQTLVRWRYRAPGWHWYWEIDDVELTACQPGPPGLYFEPEFQEGAGCLGDPLEYELSLLNQTGSAGTFSLAYQAVWPTSGPAEISAAAGQVFTFTVSVSAACSGEDTATITAMGNGHQAQAQVRTAGTPSWSAIPSLPTPRGDLALVASGDALYAIGGTTGGGAPLGTNERFDLSTEAWASQAPMPLGLTLIDGVSIGGTIYIPGGHDGSQHSAAHLAYNTAADVWITGPPAPRDVAGYGAARCGGRLFRVGGSYWSSWPRGEVDAEVYDPAAKQWTVLPPMAHGHLWPAVACLEGTLYVAGGVDENKQPTTASERYSISAGQWDDVAMADLPRAWWGGADGVSDGRLFVAGGFSEGLATAGTLYYDPATDAWTDGPPLDQPRHRLGGAALGHASFVLGGWEPTWSAHAAADALSSCPNCLHVGSIGLTSWNLFGLRVIPAAVLVVNRDAQPMSDVLVHIRWTLPDGSHRDEQAMTRRQGRARFVLLGLEEGTYELCVQDLVAEGYVYDAISNVETCEREEVP